MARSTNMTFSMVRFVVCGIALVSGVAASADSGLPVLAGYDGAAGGLPDDGACWQLIRVGNDPLPYDEDGAAVLGPTTDSGLIYWEYFLPQISFADGASITARVNVTQSSWWTQFPFKRNGFYIGLRDHAGQTAWLGISSDRLILLTNDPDWNAAEYLMNTVGKYHDYALHISGNTVEAIVDGMVVMTGQTAAGTAGASQAFIGDGSIHANSLTRTSYISVSGVPNCGPADLNCDGVVDGVDLLLLLSNWGLCTKPHVCWDECRADINGDGNVDGLDLLLLLMDWG